MVAEREKRSMPNGDNHGPHRREWVHVAGSLVLVTGICILDFFTEFEIRFDIFYAIPVAYVTWLVSRRCGVAVSAVTVLAWFVTDHLSRPIELSPLIPAWNAVMRLGYFLIIAYVLGALKDALRREEAMARSDFLTKSANRRAFYEVASTEIARAARYAHPFTVAYTDIDDYKVVNDNLGHEEGDRVLRKIAEIMTDELRGPDFVARLGGDEFAVLLPETDGTAAQQVLSRLRTRLLDAMRQEGWPVTFSIGAVTFLKPPDTVDEMLNEADILMYAAKNSGKDTIHFGTFGGEVAAPTSSKQA
jgi:diguanylate cyclase (GGDEF)-like protein